MGKKTGSPTWISPAEFHTFSQKHPTAVKTVALQKEYVHEETKAVDDAERVIRFTISTGNVDRDRDIVQPGGVKIDNYLKNPLVLFGHDYSSLPVAKTLKLSLSSNRWTADAQFASHDLYPFADTVYRMLGAGFLNASSIGFRPIEWAYNEDRRGMDFMSIELLEWSVVPVPAHPEALVEARSAGIDIAPLKAWAEKVLDGWKEDDGLYVPRDQAEAVYKIAANQPVVVPVIAEPPTPKPAKSDPDTEPKNADGQKDPPTGEKIHDPNDGEPVGKRGRVLSATHGNFEVTLPKLAANGKVVLDGEDISHLLTGITIEGAVGQLTRVILDVLPESIKADVSNADVITKRGRVLSARNEQKLRDAVAAIEQVLSQIAGQPEEPTEPDDETDSILEIDANTASKGGDSQETPIELPDVSTEPTELTIDIDPDQLRALLRGIVSETVEASTTRAINAVRGRIN